MTKVSSAVGITPVEILEELFPGARARISVVQGEVVLRYEANLPSDAVVIIVEELAR